MARGFEKLNITSAVKATSQLSLGKSHLTTLNLGQIVPIYSSAILPGDKFNVTQSIFSRCAPLVVPTYGRAELKTAAFFVPYFQVAEDAEAFIAGKRVSLSYTTYLRSFYVKTMMEYLVDADNALVEIMDAKPEGRYDFYFIDSTGTAKYAKFTVKGKYVIKVLNMLGYRVPEKVNLQTTSDWYKSGFGAYKLNAMPLLCFFKAYNDWMSQSQRFNMSALSKCLEDIRRMLGSSSTGYINSTGFLNAKALEVMFDNLFLCYENDYFTSAWYSPNAPLEDFESVGSVSFTKSATDGAVTNATSSSNGDNTYINIGSDGILSQRALNFLESFDNWVRRNNYAGSREVQQIYARFGIKPENFKSRYAYLLNTNSQPLQVGDVTSTAETADAVLGSYAGKGIINGNGQFSSDFNDFGHLIVLCWITVKPMYAHGFDREVLKNTALDFYNPEFDGLSANPISYAELYVDPKNDSTMSETHTDKSVFGFTERYNEYRSARDLVTGDFNIYPELSAWHFDRDLSSIRKSGDMFAQSTAMNCFPQTGSEFNRMFADTTDEEDKFYITAYFDVNATRPVRDLSGVANLGTGKLSISRNGNEIN